MKEFVVIIEHKFKNTEDKKPAVAVRVTKFPNVMKERQTQRQLDSTAIK